MTAFASPEALGIPAPLYDLPPLYVGEAITHGHDLVKPYSVALIADYIRQGSDLAARIRQLRHLVVLDQAAARRFKTTLPYFCGSEFRPAQRQMRNFVRSAYAVFDFDHLEAHGLTPDDLKNRLANDARVLLAFISPSGEGVKALVRYAQPLTDASRFAALYKVVAADLIRHHQLPEAALDTCTYDCTRVCFLSHDPAVWFNPSARPIEPEDFRDVLELQLAHGLVAAPTVSAHRQPDTDGPTVTGLVLPVYDEGSTVALTEPDHLDELLRELRPARPVSLRQHIVVPECLQELEARLRPFAEARGARVRSVWPIQFGQQIVLEIGSAFGEANIFWGQRGFTFVKTTRRGSDARVAEVLIRLLAETVGAPAAAAT